jgi:hypothetical protein
MLFVSMQIFAQSYSKTFLPTYNGSIYGGAWGRSILSVTNNTLLVQCVSGNGNVTTYTSKENLITIGLDGTIVSQFNIGNDSTGIIPMQGQFFRLNDSIIIIAGTYNWLTGVGTINDTVNEIIELNWYNKNIEQIEKVKRYQGLNANNKSGAFCIQKIYNKILVCGYSAPSYNTKNQAYILCLNDTGAILWQTYLGENNKEDIAFSSAPAADGGYLISARTDLTRYPIIGNDDSIDANNSIYKLDSNGTLQWKKVLWRSSHGVIARIQPEGLGNYYIGNAQDTTWEADDKKGYTATIAKIDELGNIIWQKYFNDEPFAYKGIWDFKTLANGDVLLIGGVFGGGNYPGERTGWLCRMAPNGNVVWQHYYKSYAATNFGVLCDAVELSNGDLVITGSASDSVSGGKQAIWLLRTDAQGCLLQGCNPLGTVQLEPIQAMQLVAYPNPTNSNIILQSNNGSLLQGVVQVLNAQGQMVYSVLQKTAIAKINLPLAKQPSGVYFVRYVSAINNTVSTLQVVEE